MPKKCLPIWIQFEEIKKTTNSGKWAKCKQCRKEMQGIPSRMLKHYELCHGHGHDDQLLDTAEISENPSCSSETASVLESKTPEPELVTPKKKFKRFNVVENCDVISTSKEYAEKLDIQIGKCFYSTNTPFLHAAHPEFVKMCNMLRPGYKPPTPFQIGGKILDAVHEMTLEEVKGKLNGQTGAISLDGWSNVHNDPIVCCSVITEDGDSCLIDSIDTSGHSHTAEYLKEVVDNVIKKAETTFLINITSVITDNTGNVTKMRTLLSQTNNNVICMGCNAHILNLLAGDINIEGVTENILKVIKYFRNKHIPAALYKSANGKKLQLPTEVRWNSVTDCIKSYLDNRGLLIQICQDNKENIDKHINRIINDVQISNNASDLISRLNPVAIALDRMQRANTTISVAVEIWIKLENDLKDEGHEVKKHFFKRRDMALSQFHYLANMLDHRFRGSR